MTKSFRIATALLATATAGAALPAVSAQAKVYTGILGNTALSGYDAVSYFSGRPVQGSKTFSTTWRGATFRFASAANLAKFKANPAAFAPQYGGHCAWAVSQGYLFAASPSIGRSSAASSTSITMATCSRNGLRTSPATSRAPTRTG